MSPFDFVKDVSFAKQNILTVENEESYIPIIINRALGYYSDTVLHANMMNMNAHLDKQLQYDFYLHGLRKRKRYTPWHKKVVNHELECISLYYKLSNHKAKEALKLLSREQILTIVERVERKE